MICGFVNCRCCGLMKVFCCGGGDVNERETSGRFESPGDVTWGYWYCASLGVTCGYRNCASLPFAVPLLMPLGWWCSGVDVDTTDGDET